MRSTKSSEIVVVGAGIAGVMTALHLLRRGHSVQLIDRWAPGHPRSASSDYSRIIRSIHGKDRLYTEWVREARLRWLELQEETGQTLFVQCGALVLASERQSDWEDSTLPTFDALGVPYFKFDVAEMKLRFPQFSFRNVAYGIFEPESGAIMSHRAVVETAKLFSQEGGKLVRAKVYTDDSERLYVNGKPLEADLIVVTAGAWMGDVFPRTIAPISKVVRQNIVYTSTPESSTKFDDENMPCWVDHGYQAYGTPSIEGQGVKAAIAWTNTQIDLNEDDRVVDEATFNRTRQYIRNRLPKLLGQRAVDQKSCQIAMTPDTHFIIDFHPRHENVLVAGGCSGHLFKHGPVFGDYAAGVGLGEFGTAERFKIGSRLRLSLENSPSGR